MNDKCNLCGRELDAEGKCAVCNRESDALTEEMLWELKDRLKDVKPESHAMLVYDAGGYLSVVHLSKGSLPALLRAYESKCAEVKELRGASAESAKVMMEYSDRVRSWEKAYHALEARVNLPSFCAYCGDAEFTNDPEGLARLQHHVEHDCKLHPIRQVERERDKAIYERDVFALAEKELRKRVESLSTALEVIAYDPDQKAEVVAVQALRDAGKEEGK